MKLLFILVLLGFQSMAWGSLALVSWGPIPTRFPKGNPHNLLDDFAQSPQQIKDIFCGPNSLIKIPWERCRFVKQDMPLSFYELEKKFNIEGIKSLGSEIYSSLQEIKQSHAPHLVLTVDAHGTQESILSDKGNYKIDSFLDMVKVAIDRFEYENKKTLKVTILFNSCFSGAIIDKIEQWKHGEFKYDIEVLSASTTHNVAFGLVLWNSLNEYVRAESSGQCDAYCTFKEIFKDKKMAHKISSRASQKYKFHPPHQVYSITHGRLTEGDKREFSQKDFNQALSRLQRNPSQLNMLRMLAYLESMVLGRSQRSINISVDQFVSLNKIFGENSSLAGLSQSFTRLMISFFKSNMPEHLKKSIFTNRLLRSIYLVEFSSLIDQDYRIFSEFGPLFIRYLNVFRDGNLNELDENIFDFILEYLNFNPKLYDLKSLYTNLDRLYQRYSSRSGLILNFLKANPVVHRRYLTSLLEKEEFSRYIDFTKGENPLNGEGIYFSDLALVARLINFVDRHPLRSDELFRVVKSIHFKFSDKELLPLIHSYLAGDQFRLGIYILSASDAWSDTIEDILWGHLEEIKSNQGGGHKNLTWELLLERSNRPADLIYERILTLEDNDLISLISLNFLDFVNKKVSTTKKNELINNIVEDRDLLARFIINVEIKFLDEWDFLDSDSINKLSSQLIEVIRENPDAVWGVSSFLKDLNERDLIMESMLSSIHRLPPTTSQRLAVELNRFIEPETRIVHDDRPLLR